MTTPIAITCLAAIFAIIAVERFGIGIDSEREEGE